MTTPQCACPNKFPDWDNTDQSWAGRCVHRLPISSFFHMPLAFDMYVRKQAVNIAQLGLIEEWPGLAFTRTGVLGGEMIRFITECNSPSRLVQRLAPPFDVRVNLHEGGIGTVQKTLQKQQMQIVDLGRSPKEAYLAHLTCPLCSDARGGDKILVARRWVASASMQKSLDKQRMSQKK